MMRYGQFIVIWLWFNLIFLAAAWGATSAPPAEVTCGVYVTQLHSLNFVFNSFKAQFWVWCLHQDAEYHPEKVLELTNAQEMRVETSYRQTLEDGRTYTGIKYSGTFSQLWDLSRYPFDTQALLLSIESADQDASQLRFVADVMHSKLEPSLQVLGWQTQPLQIKVKDFAYSTTFGMPNAEASTYSRLEVLVPLHREGVRSLINQGIGYFISCLLLLIVMLMENSLLVRQTIPAATRITLAIGAIFIAMGNKYSIDGTIGTTANFSVLDVMQYATFSLIPVAIATSVLTESLAKAERHTGATIVARLAILIYGVVMALGLGFMLYRLS